MQIVFHVPSLVNLPMWQLALYLVLYWNVFSILTNIFLALWWAALTAQTLRVAEIASDVVELLVLPPNGRTAGFANELGHVAPMLEMAACSLYANEAMNQWRAALLTQLVLSVCVRHLSSWPGVWESCGPLRKIGVVVAVLVVAAACALQWAYYATLPLSAGAEASDVHVSFLWYRAVVNAVALLTRCLVVLVSVGMRAAGYPLLVAVMQRTRLCSPRRLTGSAADPSSYEFKLAARYVTALFLAGVGWSYAPEGMPLVFQGLVLVRVLAAFGAMTTLRTYRQVLLGFPDVPAPPQDRCGICLEDFVLSETVKRLPCGHCFHGPCVRQWLVQHADCPLCRQSTQPPPREVPGPANGIHLATSVAPREGPRPPQRGETPRAPRHRRQPPPPLPEPRAVASTVGFTGSIRPLAPRLPMPPTHVSPAEPGAVSSTAASSSAAPPQPHPRSEGSPPHRQQPSYNHLHSLAQVEKELAAVSQARRRRQDDLFRDEPLPLLLQLSSARAQTATEPATVSPPPPPGRRRGRAPRDGIAASVAGSDDSLFSDDDLLQEQPRRRRVRRS